MTPSQPDTSQDPAAPLEQTLFRDIMGRFASGVTIITTRANDRDFGTTSNAVTSLSLNPPMLLVCLNETSETRHAVLQAGAFAVNILGEDQVGIAQRFATKSASKFQDVELVRASSGIPLIDRALVHLECRVSETVTGGTHTVFLAEVHSATAAEGSPLTYYRGRFGRFEDSLQEAAYRQLREMVLDRSLPLGEPLEVDQLAEQLGLERPRVYYALTKLTAVGLVVRDDQHGYMVRPLDARLADEALQTRALLEAAVAEAVAVPGQLDTADADELRRYADQACLSVEQVPVDVKAGAVAGLAFHEKFVGLLGNGVLVDVYRRLPIDATWLRAFRGHAGENHVDPHYLRQLVDACAAGDAGEAKRIVLDHATRARKIAQLAIDRAGGEV
jgi:flavin reductase (DIM6/NTAB) family NADH-FMN oxidoreductase RutF/DNA-binding GntR family transcriptional regulator